MYTVRFLTAVIRIDDLDMIVPANVEWTERFTADYFEQNLEWAIERDVTRKSKRLRDWTQAGINKIEHEK